MLKNKLLILSLLVLILTSFLIPKTISFFLDSVEGEKIVMKMSQWRPAASSLVIVKDGVSYSIEEKIDSLDGDNPQQDFTAEENQYLSFQYKVNSSENAPGFDEPNFLVKLNGEIVFQDLVLDSNWKKGYLNLKNYKPEDDNYSLEFISENTFDEINSPTLSLRGISTAKFLAKRNDLLKFSVSKSNVSIYLKYSVEENGVVIEKQEVLSAPYEFLITEHFHNNQIEYYSVDSFDNLEDPKLITIDADFESPAKIKDPVFFAEGDLEASVEFIAPNDNFSGTPAFYEIEESGAMVFPGNHKKFGTSNLPLKSGNYENILLKNLRSGINFFTIKSIDQAGNYSEASSVSEATIY